MARKRESRDSRSGKKGSVLPKYTLSDHLWQYLQSYAEKHRQKGNGFGFGLFGPKDVARTLSARYFKDGSEILILQARKTPRRLTPRECARLMGFDQPWRTGFPDSCLGHPRRTNSLGMRLSCRSWTRSHDTWNHGSWPILRNGRGTKLPDIVDARTRSRMMAGIRGKDTKPERLIRHALHARGLRYRLHASNVPGRPDLIFPRFRAAVFIHGCFWHGHACPSFSSPWHPKRVLDGEV